MATTWEKHDSVQREFASARKPQEETMESRRHLLGEEHPDTLAAMARLARTLYRQGDWAGARKLQEQVLATRRRLLGEEHPDTLTAMSNLAVTLTSRAIWRERGSFKNKCWRRIVVCWARNIPAH